jgi:hypothetical protein
VPDNEKKNGSSLPENDESNVSLSAADNKSAACRASSRRRHAVFAKRKKQAAGRPLYPCRVGREHRIKNKENQFIDFRLIATKRGKTTLFPLFVNSLTGRRAACGISPDATGR